MAKTKNTIEANKTKIYFLIALFISTIILAGIATFAITGSPNDSLVNNSSCTKMAAGNDKAVCYAKLFRAQGIYESPAKTDKGPWIDYWNKMVGAPVGSYWCASFVSWVLKYGHASSEMNTPSTVTMKNRYDASPNHLLIKYSSTGTKLIPGDVLFRSRPEGGGHVGIVTSANSDGNFYTIEGNTQCTNGNGCLRNRLYNRNGTCPSNDGTYSSCTWEYILRW